MVMANKINPRLIMLVLRFLIRFQCFKFNLCLIIFQSVWQQHVGNNKVCFSSPGLVTQGVIVTSKFCFCRGKCISQPMNSFI